MGFHGLDFWRTFYILTAPKTSKNIHEWISRLAHAPNHFWSWDIVNLWVVNKFNQHLSSLWSPNRLPTLSTSHISPQYWTTLKSAFYPTFQSPLPPTHLTLEVTCRVLTSTFFAKQRTSHWGIPWEDPSHPWAPWRPFFRKGTELRRTSGRRGSAAGVMTAENLDRRQRDLMEHYGISWPGNPEEVFLALMPRVQLVSGKNADIILFIVYPNLCMNCRISGIATVCCLNKDDIKPTQIFWSNHNPGSCWKKGVSTNYREECHMTSMTTLNFTWQSIVGWSLFFVGIFWPNSSVLGVSTCSFYILLVCSIFVDFVRLWNHVAKSGYQQMDWIHFKWKYLTNEKDIG